MDRIENGVTFSSYINFEKLNTSALRGMMTSLVYTTSLTNLYSSDKCPLDFQMDGFDVYMCLKMFPTDSMLI